VYIEQSHNINDAIAREKQLKGWLRQKKLDLINSQNPEWKDLSENYFVGDITSIRDPSFYSG